MNRLYLIRHGEPASGWGDAGGSPDPGLTALGRRQAEASAETLMALPVEQRPQRVLSSPMRRCRETAEPLAAALGVAPQIEAAVTEIATPTHIPTPQRADWLRQAMAGQWSAIEGLDGSAWRSAVVEALWRAEGAAVFTHFVAINAAVSAALGRDDVLAFKPAPGSVTTLAVEGGALRLVSLGEGLAEAGRVL